MAYRSYPLLVFGFHGCRRQVASRVIAGVLGEMLIATCETIAKARGNPFTPSPEG